MAQLFVPKSTVDAEIRDGIGRVRNVQFFLSEDIAEGRRERLQDLLRGRRFIPVKVVTGEAPSTKPRPAFELMNRDHFIWVRLDLLTAIDEIDLDAEGADESVSAGVRIDLSDGSTLDCALRYLLPSDARRVGDYLETLPPFFPVRTDDHLYLIQRDRVVAVTPDEVKR